MRVRTLADRRGVRGIDLRSAAATLHIHQAISEELSYRCRPSGWVDKDVDSGTRRGRRLFPLGQTAAAFGPSCHRARLENRGKGFLACNRSRAVEVQSAADKATADQTATIGEEASQVLNVLTRLALSVELEMRYRRAAVRPAVCLGVVACRLVTSFWLRSSGP
jgi:hypothetical protein